MRQTLSVSIGQCSEQGRKPANQDYHAARVPAEPALGSKGIVVALADGISSSPVSQEAAQEAVNSFINDYYCTPDAWSTKKSGEQVLAATNSRLHVQTRQSDHRYDRERGYVCTFSAVVIKSATAHLFHIGDARIYLLRDGKLTQLTEDHRVCISSEQSYLARALGMDRRVEVDHQSLLLASGDIFLLATDGVYEYIDLASVPDEIAAAATLDSAARNLVAQALHNASPDNLTLQLVRIESLPSPEANEFYSQLTSLPCPPQLKARDEFEGYRIVREIKASSRSHIYLALDPDTDERVVIKIPSVDLHANMAALERFLLEAWIARRIDNPHVLKPRVLKRPRQSIYIVSEYIEGQTLQQWMTDHPKPGLSTVRDLIAQIARGLQAFHRLEMVHQDLKPENIMIDQSGTVKIIDFGATRVAGIEEIVTPFEQINLLGAVLYAAPEYFLGEAGNSRSDIYSLGVITYQMLSGRFPYGTQVPKSRTRAAQRKLVYQSVLSEEREIPVWIDEAIRKAVHPNPEERYEELSEFIYDLHHPSQAFLIRTRPPLIERNPLVFWKSVAFLLAVLLLVSLSSNSHGMF